MKEKFKAVLVETDEAVYLYPKKRSDAQKIIKTDEIGKCIWSFYSIYEDIEKVIQAVCEKYNVISDTEKALVANDVNNFIEKIESRSKLNIKGKKISNEVSFMNLFSEMQAFYRKNKKPFKFFIEITYACNLRCKHCYRGESVAEEIVFLEKEYIFNIFDELEKLGVVEVILTGGETFLHPDIFEILERATKKNFVVTVLSNGNYICDRASIEKLKGLDIFDIRISIYGNEKHHDQMTGVEGSYQKSFMALKMLNEELGIGTAAFVVTKENYEDCEYVFSEMRRNNINIAANSMITPTARGCTEPCKLRITPQQYELMMERYNLPITGTTCTAGISRFRIDPFGNISPCELIPDSSFGNIKNNSIKDILCSPKRDAFLKMMEQYSIKQKCVGCDNRKICNYCPALFFQENKSFETPSEYLCCITETKKKLVEKRDKEYAC